MTPEEDIAVWQRMIACIEEGSMKHDLEIAESKIFMLRQALVGFIGTDDKEELGKIESAARLLPNTCKDKWQILNAVLALNLSTHDMTYD